MHILGFLLTDLTHGHKSVVPGGLEGCHLALGEVHRARLNLTNLEVSRLARQGLQQGLIHRPPPADIMCCHVLSRVVTCCHVSPVVAPGARVDPLSRARVRVDAAHKRGPAEMIRQAVRRHMNLNQK